MAGIYIHIPFCKSRCIYCGFYSTTLGDSYKTAYADALCKELQLRTDYVSETIETIYFGGGTPSLMPVQLLQTILKTIFQHYHVNKNAEITMECNPDDITSPFVSALKAMGVNRVSLGVQTFSDERLALIRRRHSAADVKKAIQCLQRHEIYNISIDLMFGFPNETLNDWAFDIKRALALKVTHISAYSLMFEESTPLYDMLEKGEIKEVPEDVSLNMYKMLIAQLKENGYEQYEISNFALPGFRSRHNSSYWKRIPYIGIGAAAHSYNITSRQWNISNVQQYIATIGKNSIPMEIEHLDKPTMYDDWITTAMRTCEGIDLRELHQEFGEKYEKYFMDQAQQYLNRGWLEQVNNHIRLTQQGLFVSDMVMSDLMIAE